MARTLYLHSGHHGHGTGSHGFIDEGDETIRLCDEIARHLTCKFVRSDKTKPISTALINAINAKFGANALICDIHFNAFDGRASGCEVFISSKAGKLTKSVAEEMMIRVHSVMGNTCRGVKTDGHSQHSQLAILSGTESPAILVEPCFVDNKQDVLRYQQNFERLAMAIADVLNSYCK